MSVQDNVLLAAPLRASAATLAKYDRDPALWPNVRVYKTHEVIVAEMRDIARRLKEHPTNQTRRFQLLRNKRKLLFAKKLLVQHDLPPGVAFGLALVRQQFSINELWLPGDPPYDKRKQTAFLMEFSKFIGQICPKKNTDLCL